MVLWIAGITISLVSVLIALVKAYYMARHSVSVHSEEPNTFLARLCNQMGITSQPRLVTADWASTPMTLRMDGRYVVVVPEELLMPNRGEDLQLVLAHELAHVKRRDLDWSWLHTIVKALFFFNPLIWVAGRELRIAQEMACDEMAVRAHRHKNSAVWEDSSHHDQTIPWGRPDMGSGISFCECVRPGNAETAHRAKAY